MVTYPIANRFIRSRSATLVTGKIVLISTTNSCLKAFIRFLLLCPPSERTSRRSDLSIFA